MKTGNIVILNYDDKTLIDTLPPLQRKCFETLLSFEVGSPLVYKEGTLSHQDTSAQSYPLILKDFIKDVNKSSELIIKSILCLYAEESTRKLINDNLKILGHDIEIDTENKKLISLNTKHLLLGYMDVVRKNAKNILENLDRVKIKSDLSGEKRDKLKKYLNGIVGNKREYGSPKFLLRHFYSYLGEILKDVNRANTSADVLQSIDIFVSKQGKKESNIFYYLYHSANLYDEAITPKKSFYNRLQIDNIDVEVIALECCAVKKRGVEIKGEWSFDFSFEYYLKKHIIERLTKKDFFTFMGIYKDFQSRDQFQEEYSRKPREFNDKHPEVINMKYLTRLIGEIEALVREYNNTYLKIQELIDYLEINAPILKGAIWKNDINSRLIRFKSDSDAYSALEVLNHLNKSTTDKIKGIISSYSASQSESFTKHLIKESYMKEAVTNILDDIYEQNSNEVSGYKNETTFYKEKATFHKIMNDSFVIDFRDSSQQELNDAAIHLCEKSASFTELCDVLRTNSYHNFYEFDKDIFSKDSIVNIEYLIAFFKKSSELELPIKHKCGFKLRKLGNFLALGVYFLHTKTMGLDFREGREGMKSYIHEMAHHIDLNGHNPDRNRMVSRLHWYFRDITERREYYLKPEELIARGAEIAKILHTGKYKELRLNDSIQPQQLIDSLKINFLESKESRYMGTWEEYSNNPAYINIEQLINELQYDLLDTVDIYYGSFWSNRVIHTNMIDSTDTKEIISSIHSKSHNSYNYDFADIYNLDYGKFNLDEYSKGYASFLNMNFSNYAEYSHEQYIRSKTQVKKLWMVFVKYGQELFEKEAIKHKSFLFINRRLSCELEDEFKGRFGSEPDYENRLATLRFVVLHLKTFLSSTCQFGNLTTSRHNVDI